MNKQFFGALIFAFTLVNPFISRAQTGVNGYNPNSVRGENRMIYGQPIYENDVMYRTTIWRKINLQEKQNQPFFAVDNEITAVIFDLVEQGKLQPYRYDETPRADGVSEQMTKEEFFSGLSYYSAVIDEDVRLKPRDLFILEIKEDLVFDRRRSRMYWDIQTVTISIPPGVAEGINFLQRVASFKYKDLDKHFRDLYEASKIVATPPSGDPSGTPLADGGTTENLRAHWVNPYNKKEHMCLADALEMRLFSSRIIKVSNPSDDNIVTIIQNEYGADNPDMAKKVLEMSRQIEYDLMEYEHNLWEY